MRRLLFLACVLLAFSRPAGAEPLAGQSDPRFQTALATWLADDEANGVPALAALAGGGTGPPRSSWR